MEEMWTRRSLKDKAKSVLKSNYWKAFLVSIVIAMAGGNSGSHSDTGRDLIDEYTSRNGSRPIELMDNTMEWVVVLIVVAIVLMALRLLIGYTFEVGGRKFFIRATKGESETEYLLYGFKEKRYRSILLTMLTRDIYVFLWTLLLIIPGIIKLYAYRMVPYILADNPHIGRKRAIELSEEMTKDEKWNIFVLDLSFIGWYLIGTILLLVGVLFVLPYENATNAELYIMFREDAIRKGLTTKQELNIVEDYI